MAGLIVILLYACKLAFLASSTCVKIIEFSLKNAARKAYLHVHKRIIIMPAIMKEVYFTHVNPAKCTPVNVRDSGNPDLRLIAGL